MSPNISRRTALARIAAVPAALAAGTGTAAALATEPVQRRQAADIARELADAMVGFCENLGPDWKAVVYPSTRANPIAFVNEGASEIQTLFREWLDVRHRYAWPETQEEGDRGFAEYRRLQDAIIFADPVCARDVAIMQYVDTDAGESLTSDDFTRRIHSIIGMPEAPLAEDLS